MNDGTEGEAGPSDADVNPPGHNAWVIGDEPVVAIDFTGLKEYAKRDQAVQQELHRRQKNDYIKTM